MFGRIVVYDQAEDQVTPPRSLQEANQAQYRAYYQPVCGQPYGSDLTATNVLSLNISNDHLSLIADARPALVFSFINKTFIGDRTQL